MLASGDWITPRFDGLKYFEKPPLQYWATAAAYAGFGVSEWSSRLWSVGLAFACLPLVYAWVARFYGARQRARRAARPRREPVLRRRRAPQPARWRVHLLADRGAAGVHRGAERAARLRAGAALDARGLGAGGARGAVQGNRGRGARRRRTHAVHAHRARCRPVAAPAPGGRRRAVPGRRGAVVRRGVAAQPELPAILLRARALHALPHHRAPARRALVVFPAAAAAGGAAVAAGAAACLPARLAAGRRGVLRASSPLRFLLLYAALTLVFFSASGSKLAPYILPMLPVLAAVTGAGNPRRWRWRAPRHGSAQRWWCWWRRGLLIYSARVNSFVPQAAWYWALGAVAAALAAAAHRRGARVCVQPAVAGQRARGDARLAMPAVRVRAHSAGALGARAGERGAALHRRRTPRCTVSASTARRCPPTWDAPCSWPVTRASCSSGCARSRSGA